MDTRYKKNVSAFWEWGGGTKGPGIPQKKILTIVSTHKTTIKRVASQFMK